MCDDITRSTGISQPFFIAVFFFLLATFRGCTQHVRIAARAQQARADVPSDERRENGKTRAVKTLARLLSNGFHYHAAAAAAALSPSLLPIPSPSPLSPFPADACTVTGVSPIEGTTIRRGGLRIIRVPYDPEKYGVFQKKKKKSVPSSLPCSASILVFRSFLLSHSYSPRYVRSSLDTILKCILKYRPTFSFLRVL